MPVVTAGYGTPFDFIAFFRYFHTFLKTMSVLLYLHQTFTDCVSERLFILIRFFANFTQNDEYSFLKFFIFTKNS